MAKGLPGERSASPCWWRRGLPRPGASAVAVRIVPAAPFAIEGAVAGALRVKRWEYEIAAALESPDKATWWIAGAALLTLVATTWLVKRWLARQPA